MHDSEQQKGELISMSPRISFSNDFVDAQLSLKQEMIRSSKSKVASSVSSSDFEFSVSNYSMTSAADELFSKGRILPFRADHTNSNTQIQRTTTLKEELLLEDHDYDNVSFSQSKGNWIGFWGLKRSHITSKKPDQQIARKASSHVDVLGSSENLVHDEETHINKSSQVR